MLSFLVRLPPAAKRLVLLGVDATLIPLSLWCAFALRLGEWTLPEPLYWSWVFASFVLVSASLPLYVVLRLYRTVMRHLQAQGLWRMALAAGCSGGMLGVLTFLPIPDLVLPRSLFLIFTLVLFFWLAGSRATAARLLGGNAGQRGEPVAIYGAGEAGRQLAATLRMGLEFMPAVFLDRDPSLKDRSLDTLNVLDPYREDLAVVLRGLGVREILLAIPELDRMQRRSILERLAKLMFHVRTVPSMEAVLSGKARLDQLEEVSVDDLLGRDQVPALPGLLDRNIRGKTVLVTGAGGSIGSELCRQSVAQGVLRLVMVEHSEVALYHIEMELQKMVEATGRTVRLVPVLGSVTDATLVARVFRQNAVDTVYHAAAYKHVPMVEENPFQGVFNNVEGTRTVAEAAWRAGVERFVLISTDKAVRPTNVMGASKRMAELVVQAMAAESQHTVFSMVRFGNVLGSSGSVVPLFRRQIAEGGPITVTHREVTRYFMTIPEAVQLVIQAGAMASGGEVFVLDMGEPVRIVDLAVKMIHLSGRRVKVEDGSDVGIEIQYTGLRPGEKLYEELLIGDAVGSTEHPRIMRAEEASVPMPQLNVALGAMERAIDQGNRDALIHLLEIWVSGYKPDRGPEPGAEWADSAMGLKPLFPEAEEQPA